MPGAKRSLMRQLLVRSRRPEETEQLGCALGEAAFAGCVIGLTGPLGAGKTVLAQGIARGLGVADPVTSPTFVYVRIHHGRLPFYHVDLYQISRIEEAESLGLDELLAGDSVVAIEWPERIAAWLPSVRLDVLIQQADGDRVIELSATDPEHMGLIRAAAGA